MFHIKTLELVHWDFWRRFSLPLDAQIITIVGPNGSGKTTLLDALRTLFALRCSGKRDFRRYVRRADRSFAWIRAVVANLPGNTGKRPFFPCLADEVTLACRIRKAGGDWIRDYTIVDGNLPIEALEAQPELTVQVRRHPPELSAEEHQKFLVVYRDGQFQGFHELGRNGPFLGSYPRHWDGGGGALPGPTGKRPAVCASGLPLFAP